MDVSGEETLVATAPVLAGPAHAHADVHGTEEEALAAAAAALTISHTETDEEALEAVSTVTPATAAPPVSEAERESSTTIGRDQLLTVPDNFSGRKSPQYGQQYLKWLGRLFPTQVPSYARQGGGLGVLEVFPTEINQMVLASLDLESLSHMRRTCSKANYLVQTLLEGRKLQRVPSLIIALGYLELLGRHSVTDMLGVTALPYCECCLSVYNNEPGRRWKPCILQHPDAKARYGDLFLPTLERVCHMCYKNCQGSGRYRLVPENFAYQYFGLHRPTQLCFRAPWSPKQWRFEKYGHRLAVMKDAWRLDYPYSHRVGPSNAISFAELTRLALRQHGSLPALHKAIWENMCRREEKSTSPWYNTMLCPTGPDHSESEPPACLMDLEDRHKSSSKRSTYDELAECTSECRFDTPSPLHSLWPCWDEPMASRFDMETHYPVHVTVPFWNNKGQEEELLQCWGCFVNGRARRYYHDAPSDRLMRKPAHVPLDEEDWDDCMSRLLYTAAELRRHQEECVATKFARKIIALRHRTAPPADSYWRTRHNHYVNYDSENDYYY